MRSRRICVIARSDDWHCAMRIFWLALHK